MKIVRYAALLAVFAVSLAGCKDVSPAVIVEPTDASRQALQDAINAQFNTSVMIAADALTDSSVLYIDRRELLDDSGTPLEGRRLDKPFEFRLVTDGRNCILVDQRDESRHILANTRCKAEE